MKITNNKNKSIIYDVGSLKILSDMKNFVLILFLALTCENTSSLTLNELNAMMGNKACIEGVLVTMPQGPTLITSSAIIKKPNSNLMLPPRVKNYEHESNDISFDQKSSTTNSTITKNFATIEEANAMSSLYELARYNQIQHQYRLISEEGPSHKKKFTVVLKLDDEEYEAEGESIKKAQQYAAAMALKRTEFKHPPHKTNQKEATNSKMVTPTVELNALVTKRCEKAIYVLENGPPTSPASYMPQSQFYPRHVFNPKKSRNRNFTQSYKIKDESPDEYKHKSGEPFFVTLRVGDREYSGMGSKIQDARHDAAAKAVQDIKEREAEESQHCSANNVIEGDVCTQIDTGSKSPISFVHEVGGKNKMNVVFEISSESGPPHKKVFVTRCRVGDIVIEAEGSSKKVSKKNAAEKMLEELNKFGLLPKTNNLNPPKRKRSVVNKKKQRNLIKVNTDPNVEYLEKTNSQSVFKSSFKVENGEPNKGTFTEGGLPAVNDHSASFEQNQDKIGSSESSASGYSTGSSSTNNGGPPQTSRKPRSVSQSGQAKDQLIYLAQVLGFQVQFSDFSKISHETYLALVSMSTNPPQICRGEGPTVDMSHEKAALEAITMLSKLGLDDIAPNKENNVEFVNEIVNSPNSQTENNGFNQNDLNKQS